MDDSNYKIGLKEFISLAIIVVGIAISDDSPAFVFQKNETAGWMQPIVSAAILIIPFVFIFKVIRHFDMNDFSLIIKQILGKHIGTISLVVLWLLLTYRTIVESAIYTNIIETMFYSKTPTTVLYFLLIAVAGFIAYKGIVHIGSVAWILFVSIQISLLAVLILGGLHGNIEYLTPLFGNGASIILKQGYHNVTIYLDLLFI